MEPDFDGAYNLDELCVSVFGAEMVTFVIWGLYGNLVLNETVSVSVTNF